jgi:hypothetical protein
MYIPLPDAAPARKTQWIADREFATSYQGKCLCDGKKKNTAVAGAGLSLVAVYCITWKYFNAIKRKYSLLSQLTVCFDESMTLHMWQMIEQDCELPCPHTNRRFEQQKF